jgi:hypothetical protein
VNRPASALASGTGMAKLLGIERIGSTPWLLRGDIARSRGMETVAARPPRGVG